MCCVCYDLSQQQRQQRQQQQRQQVNGVAAAGKHFATLRPHSLSNHLIDNITRIYNVSEIRGIGIGKGLVREEWRMMAASPPSSIQPFMRSSGAEQHPFRHRRHTCGRRCTHKHMNAHTHMCLEVELVNE